HDKGVQVITEHGVVEQIFPKLVLVLIIIVFAQVNEGQPPVRVVSTVIPFGGKQDGLSAVGVVHDAGGGVAEGFSGQLAVLPVGGGQLYPVVVAVTVHGFHFLGHCHQLFGGHGLLCPCRQGHTA